MEEPVNVDGQAKVLLDNDKMKAYLEITPPMGSGQPVNIDKVNQALSESKVVVGIDENKLKEALLETSWGKRMLVAQGQVPVNGTDAQIIYKFANPFVKLAPRVDDQGRVDYRDLGLIHNVQAGEELVERIPPTEGEPGIDVMGRVLPPKKGKDIRIPRGKNTVADEQETRLYATVAGHASIIDNKVLVNPVFELNGDVDYSSGNIEFVGSVIIRGNVASGFKVTAGGDLEVAGFIEGAIVEAAGSILVKGGITAGNKGIVKAGQNILARFIENSRLEAGEDIIVREAIMQSFIKAGKGVKVTDKKATIVGGVIQAGHEVESKILGSQLATQTIVEVGINPQYREEYQQLLKTKTEKTRLIENLNHNLQLYQRQGISPENLSDKKRIALIKLLDDFKKMRQELTGIEERMAYLEGQFAQVQAASVKATEIAYPGVRISIGNSIYVVNDAIKYSQFVLDDGEVRITSL